MTQIDGLVLAGGQSRRMGQDKACLDWRGQPLLNHQLQLLAQAGTVQQWVSGDYPDYPMIADSCAHQGPLLGLLSALQSRRAHCNALLVIAVDMPLIPVSWLAAMCQHSQQQLTPLAYQQSFFPLLLPTSPQVINTLEQLTQDPNGQGRSLKRFLAQLPVTWLNNPLQHQYLQNTNTPEDYQQALAQVGER